MRTDEKGTRVSELDAEDAKLVVLARGAMARAEAGTGQAIVVCGSFLTVAAVTRAIDG